MNINWYGQTCFKISSQRGKGDSLNLLIDPLTKDTGLRGPKSECDIMLLTGHKSSGLDKECFLISGPGEYDVKGCSVQGISDHGEAENTIYVIKTEEIALCHLGLLKQKELEPEQIEAIGDVDILMIPVGGEEALDSKEALKIMTQIEPKITIPMYYKIPKLKPKLGSLEGFLKEAGVKNIEPLPKLSIKKKDIPSDSAKIIILKP
jgi:L-ascorbate metabolism protein UlaG (beta-lactamase superfamily)